MRVVRRCGVAGLMLAAALSVGLRAQARAPQAPGPAADLALDRVLPLDAAVRTGTLENGLRYFIRRNAHPEKRVSLRLAVNAGSIQEENEIGRASCRERV